VGRIFLIGAAFIPVVGLTAWHAFHFHFLTDDAFISFRYARNLIDGHGLVFNLGDRVEGYTNFLWVLELAAVWKFLGLRPEIASTLLSGLLTGGTLLVTALLASQTPFRGRRVAAAWAALLLLAVNRSFAVWTSGGLETRQFTFLVVLAAWFLCRRPPRPVHLVSASLALAAAELTRPEGLMIWGCALAWHLFSAREGRHLTVRGLLSLAVPFAVIVGGHFLFRLAYYGDWLPNTYYAKHIRAWPEAGSRYLIAAVLEHGLYLVWPLAAVGLFARVVRGRDFSLALFALWIGTHCAYLMHIGGDHFEWRPMDFHWPLLAVATVDGVLAIVAAVERRARTWGWESARFIGWSLAALGLAVTIVYSTAIQVAKDALTSPKWKRDETMGLHVDITPENFPPLHWVPLIGSIIPEYNRASGFLTPRMIGNRQVEHRVFWRLRDVEWSAYEVMAEGDVLPEGIIASDFCVGIMGFHLREITLIDEGGLTDREVARMEVTKPNRLRFLAHDRAPAAAYLRERGVNTVVRPAAHRLKWALRQSPYALRVAEDLWMPFLCLDSEFMREAFEGRDVICRGYLGAENLEINWVLHGGQILRGAEPVGLFDDGGTDGWQLSGEMRVNRPSLGEEAGKYLVTGAQGDGYLNSLHPTLGHEATGEAVSPPFERRWGSGGRVALSRHTAPVHGPHETSRLRLGPPCGKDPQDPCFR
jgi:arabinofuranosyltransferase